MPERLIRYILYLLMVPLVGAIYLPQPSPTQAQADTVISVSIPQFLANFFSEDLFDEFEAAHPGVQVNVVTTDSFGLTPVETGTVEEYLEAVSEWVSAADVVLVDSGLSPEATRAGYLLNLAPLVNSDASLDNADFYRALWESFRWDGGVWALPAAGDAVMLFYDPAAFDEAGLTYPDASWTIADLDNAIRVLTRYQPDGSVEKLALQNLESTTELMVSLLGESLVRDDTPYFDNPRLADLLTVWAQLDSDGLLSMSGGTMIISGEDTSPMVISRTAFAAFSDALVPAPLPGGRYAVNPSGFAVSSGTQSPELAYELVKYITSQPAIANQFFGSVPARKSLQGVQVETEGPRFAGGERSPEVTAALQDALENGMSLNETRFANYLSMVSNKVTQDGLDVRTALQETEVEILERLAAAEQYAGEVVVTVATPVPPVQAAEGEITLKLGVVSNVMPFPDKDGWETQTRDFAANDPEVGAVQFDTPMRVETEQLAESYDCFYMPNNVVPDVDLSLLRSFDPLLNGDPNYNPDDMAGGVMGLMQRDGQTWGFPAMIQPQAMRYNPMLFEQAGVPLPQGEWTVDEFENALRSVYAHTNETPFVPRSFGSSHLLMLIAAYGGVFDPESGSLDLNNPATIDAIRQVLTLAKDGLMDYQQLAQSGGGGGMRVVIAESDSNPTALYTELLSGFGFGPMRVEREEGGAVINPNKLITFPRGVQTAVSYDISAFYISAQSQHAEACYRLIQHLTASTSLFQAMPARRSQIQELALTQGQDAVDFYSALDDLMRQPDTVNLPTPFSGGTPASFIGQYWLNRAFDRYVLEDANLDEELAQAQQFTAEYDACAAAIPAFNPAENPDFRAFFQQYDNCAMQVDPSYGS